MSTAPAAAPKPLKVLVIEDSEVDALLLLEQLRAGGYAPDARRVDNAEDLMAALDTHKWDIIFSDHNMPRFNSTEALEIVPTGVNKAAGLARVAEILGIPREETIAIGDGENDISMLRWAGLGIAMANAPENVKAAADVIAPACDEDGAAWAMEKYLL